MVDQYTSWVQEPGSRIWHGLTDNPDGFTTRAGCGWEPDAMVRKTIWPVHPSEPGPPEFERCQWCAAAAVIRR
jgi:hypothetical protein